MNETISVYKKSGETPLECTERFRNENVLYENVPIGYAGRLDPMAEGVLLLLIGDANKERDEYMSLPKTYTIDILFGVETDSYDILGKVAHLEDSGRLTSKDISAVLEKFVGEFKVPYPPFSSKPVSGKPLFRWARENRLHEIDIPNTKGHINKIEYLKTRHISALDLLKIVSNKINNISGDFRQKEIIKTWEDSLDVRKDQNFAVATVRVWCESGTYMRSLAHLSGEKLGTGAIALYILRESVGGYGIKNTK